MTELRMVEAENEVDWFQDGAGEWRFCVGQDRVDAIWSEGYPDEMSCIVAMIQAYYDRGGDKILVFNLQDSEVYVAPPNFEPNPA